MLPKALVTTLSTAVTTLRLGGDTTISNTNSQLVTTPSTAATTLRLGGDTIISDANS